MKLTTGDYEALLEALPLLREEYEGAELDLAPLDDLRDRLQAALVLAEQQPAMEVLFCDQCGTLLEHGQSGLCDGCLS